LSKAVSAYIERIIDFCLDCVHVLRYIYWLAYVELPLCPWNETNLIMVHDLLDVLLGSVYKYFIEIFASMFIKENGP
jgi:hypothetical protein